MIAVVIPAHNEASCIAACLSSVNVAAHCPQLLNEPVVVVVAVDHSTDTTAEVATSFGAQVVLVSAKNVGIARRAGALRALHLGARWLAFTDADTVVSRSWLSSQLALNSDVVCGTVQVDDWQGYGDHMQLHYAETYSDRDDHRHIHGANLGVSSQAYRAVGGFAPLESSEDVALVNALQEKGCKIAWSAAPRVTTSARRDFRAPAGFGATLTRINDDALRYVDEDSI